MTSINDILLNVVEYLDPDSLETIYTIFQDKIDKYFSTKYSHIKDENDRIIYGWNRIF